MRHIGFRVDPGESPDWPRVTVLVDGDDVIGRITGFQGFDPDQVLVADGPLVPRDPPRRVAIYRCSCGEAGCGCAACVIAAAEGAVRWHDFRDFVGEYVEPTLQEDPTGGMPQAVPDLLFDADQYAAELERAVADRSWETGRRRVARLLRSRLLADAEALAGRGYSVRWVVPELGREQAVDVGLRAGDGHLDVRLDADLRLPEDEAVERMASELLDEPEARWQVLRRFHWPGGGS